MTPHSLATPLRVAYVLKRYPRFSETFIVNEILALERQGVEVEIFACKPATEGCFHSNLALVKANVTYLSASPHKLSSFLDTLRNASSQLTRFHAGFSRMLGEDTETIEQGLRVALALQHKSVDIVHAHFATKAASIALIASNLTDTAFTFTAHAKDIYHESVSQTDLKRKILAAKRVITVSDYNVRHLAHVMPAAKDKYQRIYNGMNLADLVYHAPDPSSHRIVSVGRLVAKKGLHLLIDAVAALRSRFPQLHCDIVGDGPLKEQLQQQVESLGLQNAVNFHGLLPQHRVHALVAGATLFAAPCVVSADGDRDGLPTVLAESMALGTPVVATDVTGIPELVRHARTGLIVPQNDSQALADAIASVISTPSLRDQLSRAGRQRVETTFDIDQNCTHLIQAWSELLSDNRAVRKRKVTA